VRVIHLTKQEQWVLFIVIVLLLLGLVVKVCRTAHPPAAAISSETVKP
jgi:hypothetical protein